MSREYHHADQVITVNKNVLWLGDFSAADDIQWLKKNNIRTIITVGDGFNLKYDASFRHYKYSVSDSKNDKISPYFEQATEKITKGLRSGSVLVHCGAGVSRSSTIIIAYLMKTKMMTFHQALKFVRGKRSVICPNLGFEYQLKKYEKIIEDGRTGDSSEGYEKQNGKVNLKPVLLNWEDDHQPGSKASTPFLKNSGINNNRNLQRMTLIKEWKLHSKPLNRHEMIISKSLTNSSANKHGQPNTNHLNPIKNEALNVQLRNKQLWKIAQFRFGLTNTSKWNIY